MRVAGPSAVLGNQRANKLSANNTVDATDAFARRYALAA